MFQWSLQNKGFFLQPLILVPFFLTLYVPVDATKGNIVGRDFLCNGWSRQGKVTGSKDKQNHSVRIHLSSKLRNNQSTNSIDAKLYLSNWKLIYQFLSHLPCSMFKDSNYCCDVIHKNKRFTVIKFTKVDF